MIVGGVGGAATGSGLEFERTVDFQELLRKIPGYTIKPAHGKAGEGVFFNDKLIARCFRKASFYPYLEEEGVNWKVLISKKLLPDDALLVIVRETLLKYQRSLPPLFH